MINKKRLLKLTQDLIRIDSQNPPGNERKIALFVKEKLSSLGIEAKIYEFKKFRSNVVAFLKRKARHTLLVTPHLDTVPAGGGWHFDPLGGRVIGDRIYGLGATDCKGNLAVLLEVITSIVEEKKKLSYNLILAATADEEAGSTWGILPLLEKKIITADAALILDADDFDIIITQKGLLHLRVKIFGKRAHGAYPERGINAIEIAVKVIAELKKLNLSYLPNRYLKPPTLNIGKIQGGDKVNIVADWCEFEADFRFLPGMDYRDIVAEVRRVLLKYAPKFKIEIMGAQKPVMPLANSNLLRYLKEAFKKVGVLARIKGSEGATVLSFFQSKRIPALATGFGVSSCAHSKDEYVRIRNLYRGALALEEFFTRYQP